MERLILRTAGACGRHPWRVVAAWIIVLAVALPFSGKAQGVLSSGGFDQNRSLRISRDLKALIQHTDGPVRTFLLGPSANYATFQDITESGLQRAEGLSSPVILIVLLVLFGAVVAALVPAVLGALSVLITFALVYAVASHTEVSVYATTMVTMIGIG